MIRFFALAVVVLTQSWPVIAAPEEVKPGTYYREGGSGTLLIEKQGLDGQFFQIETIGGNCHLCSVGGRVHQTSGHADEGNGLTCTVSFQTVGTSIKVEPLTEEGCRDFCGARAGFDGVYRALSKSCTPEGRQTRWDQSLSHYKAKRYKASKNALRSLISECKAHMNWIEIDQVRNDLALSQYHDGSPADCLATLKSTLAGRLDDEEDLKRGDTIFLPPCDFDNYITVAKATWFNRALCEKALHPSR
ncbi:hypothetical protein RQP54_01665 [Curvibacter sp. APW13]|uniref:hypothetical protein n=1 Tax=Curvibacter sp. APW13 TaxID=3077236 RepID=UPI0028DF62E8|nr:hypothetical protein [Curvibacter sp. APW13]MDT8989563.1 hypothetical protein [Curvibacter sp. APW13]